MSFPVEIYDFITNNLLVALDADVRLQKGDTVQIQGIYWKVDSAYFAVDNTLSGRSERILRMIVFCVEIRE